MAGVSTFKLAMALNLAEELAWAQKCPGPRVRRLLLNLGDYVEAEITCEDEERVCRELMWAVNTVLERLGFTVLWRVWPGYRRLHLQAYARPEEMLPIPAGVSGGGV